MRTIHIMGRTFKMTNEGIIELKTAPVDITTQIEILKAIAECVASNKGYKAMSDLIMSAHSQL